MGNGAQTGHLGWLLRKYRCDAGLTQEELAALSGLSIRALSDIERGRTGKPFTRTIQQLSDALEINDQQRAHLIWVLKGGKRRTRLPHLNGSAPLLPLIPRQLPAPLPHFAGRAAELRRMSELLDQAADGTTVISTVTGMAGVGKTTLAIHWAHQVAGRFPDGQLYANLHGFGPGGKPPAPGEIIGRFLDALAYPAECLPPDPQAREDLYRSILADRRILIVLDNARDAAQVRPLLPGGPGNLVVVTSRSQLSGLAAADGACQILLDMLGREEARELLVQRLGADRVAAEPGACDELIEVCAGLPLALGIVAARAAAHPGFSLAALARELQRADDKLDVLDDGDAATGVRAVFSWSAKVTSKPAVRLFRLLSVHPGPEIGLPAAASLAAVPPGRARGLLTELALANLLTESAPGRFGCHDLLRAYAAEQAGQHDSAASRSQALRRTLDHYLHVACAADRLLYPGRSPLIKLDPPEPGVTLGAGLDSHAAALAWFDTEHHALVAAVKAAAGHGFDTRAWQLAWTLETFFHRRGHWRDWAACQHIALAAARRQGDRFAERCALRGVASTELELGRCERALDYLAEVARLSQLDGDLATEARAELDTSRVLETQGRYAAALAHSRQALRLSRQLGGQPSSVEADALNLTGWNLARLGRYAHALDCSRHALALHASLGNKHSLPYSLDSIAYAHRGLRQYAEAAHYYHRAVTVYGELGAQYPKAQTLASAAAAHHEGGDIPAARAAWAQALAILEALHHPRAREIQAKLACLDL